MTSAANGGPAETPDVVGFLDATTHPVRAIVRNEGRAPIRRVVITPLLVGYDDAGGIAGQLGGGPLRKQLRQQVNPGAEAVWELGHFGDTQDHARVESYLHFEFDDAAGRSWASRDGLLELSAGVDEESSAARPIEERFPRFNDAHPFVVAISASVSLAVGIAKVLGWEETTAGTAVMIGALVLAAVVTLLTKALKSLGLRDAGVLAVLCSVVVGGLLTVLWRSAAADQSGSEAGVPCVADDWATAGGAVWVDSDDDCLHELYELHSSGTSPSNPDSDDDGLIDSEDAGLVGSRPAVRVEEQLRDPAVVAVLGEDDQLRSSESSATANNDGSAVVAGELKLVSVERVFRCGGQSNQRDMAIFSGFEAGEATALNVVPSPTEVVSERPADADGMWAINWWCDPDDVGSLRTFDVRGMDSGRSAAFSIVYVPPDAVIVRSDDSGALVQLDARGVEETDGEVRIYDLVVSDPASSSNCQRTSSDGVDLAKSGLLEHPDPSLVYEVIVGDGDAETDVVSVAVSTRPKPEDYEPYENGCEN